MTLPKREPPPSPSPALGPRDGPGERAKELDVEGAMNELVRLVIFRRVSTRVLVEDILQRLKIACYNEGYGDGYENAKENYTPPMGTRE